MLIIKCSLENSLLLENDKSDTHIVTHINIVYKNIYKDIYIYISIYYYIYYKSINV